MLLKRNSLFKWHGTPFKTIILWEVKLPKRLLLYFRMLSDFLKEITTLVRGANTLLIGIDTLVTVKTPIGFLSVLHSYRLKISLCCKLVGVFRTFYVGLGLCKIIKFVYYALNHPIYNSFGVQKQSHGVFP